VHILVLLAAGFALCFGGSFKISKCHDVKMTPHQQAQVEVKDIYKKKMRPVNRTQRSQI
jgi:hypothetical protein